MNNFYPLEVVGRGSETQLQVGENFTCITYRVNLVHSSTCLHVHVCIPLNISHNQKQILIA